MPDADEIPEEIATIFNVAAGFFPQANAPTSVAVRTAWGAALWPRFTVDDVCYGLARLAEHIGTDADPRRRQRREAFPDLGEVIAAADEEKRKREAGERPKLEEPAPARIRGSIPEQLAAFDMHSTGPVGPFQSRVREMIAAGVFQRGGSAEAMARLQPFTYQVAHGVVSRAMSDTPPPVTMPTPELVQEIVDSWESDPSSVDVSNMSVALRTACREEVERRREAKEAPHDADRDIQDAPGGASTASPSPPSRAGGVAPRASTRRRSGVANAEGGTA